MDESERWITECRDAGDGKGDLIVTLPPDYIAQTGLEIGERWYVSSNFSDPKDPLLLRDGITKGNVCGVDAEP